MRKYLRISILKSSFNSQTRIIFPITFLLMVFLFSGCKKNSYAKVPDADAGQEELAELQKDKVERGEYLVNTIGCADCHSPKSMGESGPEIIEELHLSGHQQGQELPPINSETLENGWIVMSGDLTAAAGPWGMSFAANLTSDETGIGNWSLEQFKTSIRKGKFKGMENGRDILPPMPWFNYALLTDEDLEAVFEYLQSTNPVRNAVPAPIPPNELVLK